MNYLETIKNNLNDEQKRRGMRDRVTVDSVALRSLIEDYERFDANARAMVESQYLSIEHNLHNILNALYKKNHDSERLMLLIMDILKPLITERIKSKTIDALYRQ